MRSPTRISLVEQPSLSTDSGNLSPYELETATRSEAPAGNMSPTRNSDVSKRKAIPPVSTADEQPSTSGVRTSEVDNVVNEEAKAKLAILMERMEKIRRDKERLQQIQELEELEEKTKREILEQQKKAMGL